MLHRRGHHEFLFFDQADQILHDGNLIEIEQFPKAVNQIDFRSILANPIVRDLKFLGLSHPDGETLHPPSSEASQSISGRYDLDSSLTAITILAFFPPKPPAAEAKASPKASTIEGASFPR